MASSNSGGKGGHAFHNEDVTSARTHSRLNNVNKTGHFHHHTSVNSPENEAEIAVIHEQ